MESQPLMCITEQFLDHRKVEVSFGKTKVYRTVHMNPGHLTSYMYTASQLSR